MHARRAGSKVDELLATLSGSSNPQLLRCQQSGLLPVPQEGRPRRGLVGEQREGTLVVPHLDGLGGLGMIHSHGPAATSGSRPVRLSESRIRRHQRHPWSARSPRQVDGVALPTEPSISG
jgi:hypothetical protein